MKLFLCMDYPQDTNDPGKEPLGIHTANMEFFVNLIKYSKVIEEFRLVLTDHEGENALKK